MHFITQPMSSRLSCPCCPRWLANAAAAARARARSGAKSASSKKKATTRKPAAKPNRIDTHHHISPRSYTQKIGPEKMVNSYPASRTAAYEWTPAMAIEDMDRGGTATAITSIYSGTHLAEYHDAPGLARECNEFAARMMQDYPGRFGMFGALPVLQIDASLKEMEYALDVLKADGVYLMTSYRNKWLGDPYYAPLFEEMNRRKAVLYTHPVVPDFAQNLIQDVPDTVVEIGTDTTRTLASLLFSGAASRYSKVQMIFSHGGGTMPFLMERFTRLAQRKQLAARMPRGIMHEVERFYYDVAQIAYPMPMAALMKTVPITQILFGTDFTFRTAAEIAAGLQGCKLSAAQHRAIDRDNALRLFPRFRHVMT
jgi:predicted TIM-barrel fold metal-dependent hydrolase